MPAACRVGVDSAGGLITGGGQSTVKIGGYAVSVVGDAIQSHGSSPHDSSTMSSGSSTVKIGGKAVCRSGDSATCGHTATSSSTVNIG